MVSSTRDCSVLSAWAALQYLLTRKGPVASSLFETGGFWYADPNARSPDIQLHLGLGSGIEAGVAAMPQGGVTLNSAYLRPRSRGTVRLASADPLAAPLTPRTAAPPGPARVAITARPIRRTRLQVHRIGLLVSRPFAHQCGIATQKLLSVGPG